MNICELVRTSFVDYPDNICAVVFTKGCNMNCKYCHNKALTSTDKKIEVNQIMKFLEKRKNLLDGITITGGEPTLCKELYEFCRKIKCLGYKIKLDTNGSNPNLLNKLLKDKLVDYVAMDIKSSPEHYNEICGLSFDYIKDSIDIIKKSENYEFRTTLYPKVSKDDIIKIIQIIETDNYYIQQYRETEFDDTKPYSDAYVKELCNELKIAYRGMN